VTLLASKPTTRTYTPEELLSLPNGNSFELVGGHLVEKNVSLESSNVEALFAFRFQAYAMERGIVAVFPSSLGYRCFRDEPDKVRRPDVTVVRVERIAALPEPNPGFMPIVPDLAVEVVSPNDIVYEVEEKVQEYLAAGFPLVWVAHPKTRTVTVHPLSDRPAIFTADDELTAESVMPGFRCKVADFFSAPAATPADGMRT